MRSHFLSVSCAFIGFFCSFVHASCYYPDGSFPSDYSYVPCSGSDFTSCCIMSEGDQCLSNGLCYYPASSSSYMFRGACTDKTWNSPNCFNHCINKTNGYADTYDRIVKCDGDRYCCDSDGSTCCNDDSKVFSLGNLSVIKDLATTTRITGGFVVASTPTGTSQTGTSFPSASKPTNTESKPGATGTNPANTAATPTSTSTTSNVPAESTSNTHNFSRTAIIGAAIGALVLLILIAGLLWFFIRRHYRAKLVAGDKDHAIPLSSDGFSRLNDKSPRPVEVPAPLHSPLPPYQPHQPPVYSSPPMVHGAVEMDNSYIAPSRNQWGQPVYEAPAQPYRHV